jgi:chaperonin GroEL (HSP60 family)
MLGDKYCESACNKMFREDFRIFGSIFFSLHVHLFGWYILEMARSNSGNVFSKNYDYLKGKEAWQNTLRLTAFAADRIRTSLGPNGSYKMVTYNRGPEKIVKITKDAVAVLEELAIQYPLLKVISEASKIHRDQVGDGVKSFVILTSALLKKADELSSKRVHPTVILQGYKDAAMKTIEILKANSLEFGNDKFITILDSVDCGRGFLLPDLRSMLLEAANSTMEEGKIKKEKIRIIRKPGGSLAETKLVKGLAIKKKKLHPNMPDFVDKPRIALTSERIGTNRLEVKMRGQGPFHMKFDIETPQIMSDYKMAEDQRKEDSLEKIALNEVNVLFSQQPIDSYSKSRLLNMGVLAFETVERSDLVWISKSTGANLVSNLAELKESDVGKAEGLETEKINLENIAILTGCDFATFIIRGSNPQILDEFELLLKNSLILLKTIHSSAKIVAGGGAIEVEIARQLKQFALNFSGKEQLAILSFADALLEIPRCIAANDGLMPDDTLALLGKLHSDGFIDAGICSDGSCGRVCSELSEVKNSVYQRAFETTSLMLRIDEQVVGKEIPKFHKK